MRSFPLGAKLYIWTVIALGAVAFINAYLAMDDWSRWGTLLAGGILAVGTSFFKEVVFGRRMGRGVPNEGVSTMSLGFVPTIFLLLAIGPFGGMVGGAINMIVTTCHPRRSYYYQVLFSVASVVLSVLVASLILRPVGLAPGDWDRELLYVSASDAGSMTTLLTRLGAIAAATAVYYFLNTAFVATAISLTAKQNPFKVWRANFLWTGPGYFAGASCATIAFATVPYLSSVRWLIVPIVLVSIPIPFVIFLLYRYHRAKEAAHQQYIDELEAKQHELERKNEELAKNKEELQQLYTSTVESLALAIDAKDQYTKEHIQRVKGVAVQIAAEMGLIGDELKAIDTAALLHDIGKIAIPEHILTKPGKLTEDEFERIKSHPAISAKILEPVHFPSPVTPSVRSHHERWDGKGYPDGLAGEDIPLGGRILAVADVYDALTSDRAYRKGWPHERAVGYLQENAGSHFDPRVVNAFLAVIRRATEADVVFDGISSFATVSAFDPSANRAAFASRDEVADNISRASFESLSLYEVSQAVSFTLALNETLDLLADKIVSVFHASSCAIILRDEQAGSNVLRVARAIGLNHSLISDFETKLGRAATGHVAETGEGMVGEFWQDDLVSINQEQGAVPAGWVPLRSMMVAPLAADGVVFGTLNLYHDRADAFDSEDLRVLQGVAAQAARAIRNAREFERTRESSITDPLTGLFNSRYLAQFIRDELFRAEKEESELSLLFLDLNNFKMVNDNFGHGRGDEVLRELSVVFQSALRSGDLVARYAGDEFVVVLPHAGPEDAEIVADKIQAAVNQYDPSLLGTNMNGLRVGVAIGAASYPRDGKDAASLVAAADAAMYRDKKESKGALLITTHPVP